MIKTIIFITLVACSVIYSQDSTKTNLGSEFITDVKYMGDDIYSYFTAPAYFGLKEWAYTAGITGATLLMICVDDEVKSKVGRKTIKTLNNDFWDIPTYYGVIKYTNFLTFGTYLAGIALNDKEIKTTGRLMIESLFLSGVSVMALRYVFARNRPYYNEGPWAFYWFEGNNETQSFPSGHTTVAFSLSTIIAERIDTWWARVFFYGLASMTGFSRIYNNQHFFSDVVVGAALGIGTSLFVLNEEEKRVKNNSSSSFLIIPESNRINFVLTF